MNSAVDGARRSSSGLASASWMDDVGAAEEFRAAQREQARVARPGTDEINDPFGFHAHSLCTRRFWAMTEEGSFQGTA